MEVKERNYIKLTNTFLIIFVFVCEILSSEVPRPRGVSLSRASLYAPEKDFTCFDGSKSVPFSQVNDDYCDCPDGSDEPGTSACPNGVFHCTNAGHKPLNIAASRVNDGICDCCDGTDEYASGANCRNNCIEQGRSAREEAQRRAELVKAGKQLKTEFSQKGIQLKQEKQAKLGELEKNKEEAEKVRAEKEALKQEAEEKEKNALEYYRKLEEAEKKDEDSKDVEEATAIFKKFDSNQDGRLEIAELQTRVSFDKDRDGKVSDEEARFFLYNQDAVDLDTFVNTCWRDVKIYLHRDGGDPLQEQEPLEENEEAQSEADDMQGIEEHDEEDHEHEDEEEEEEEEHEPPAQEDHREESLSVRYDEETKKIIDRAGIARDEYLEADRQVRSIETEIKNTQDYLDKDYGPEEEFAVLQGECFDYQDHEYIYKLCPFEKTSQQSKSGSSEIRLGNWGKWTGPEDNPYEAMLYERGQACWNGPQRSTRVEVDCGGENKVTSVSEPNRCEYLFTFITPAACRDTPADVRDELHDEL